MNPRKGDLGGAGEVPHGHFCAMGALGGAGARLEPCRRPVIDGQQVPLCVVTLVSNREHNVVGREHVSELLGPFRGCSVGCLSSCAPLLLSLGKVARLAARMLREVRQVVTP